MSEFKNDFSALKPEPPEIKNSDIIQARPKLNTAQSDVIKVNTVESIEKNSLIENLESNKFNNRRRRSLSQDANRPVIENSERNQILSRSQSQKPEEGGDGEQKSNIGSNLDCNFVDENGEQHSEKYCRVEWFDHTQKILKVTPSIKTIYQALTILAEQAKVDPAALDCFFLNDSRPLATENPIDAIVGREIRVDRRSIFRLDLIKVKRSVGIRAKWNKTIKDALESVLQKYDLQVGGAELKIAGQNSSYFQGDLPAFNTVITDFGQPVAILDGLRVIVSEKNDRNDRNEIRDYSAGFGNRMSMNVNNNNNNNRMNRSRNGSICSSGNISRHDSYCGSYSDVHSNRTSIQNYINQRGGGNSKPRGSIDDDTAALMNACDLAMGNRLDSQRGSLKKEDLELPDFLK